MKYIDSSKEILNSYRGMKRVKIEGIIRKLKKDPFSYCHLPIDYRNENLIAYYALSKEADVFSHISDLLKKDINFLTNVISKNEKVFLKLDTKTKLNKEILSSFIERLSKKNINCDSLFEKDSHMKEVFGEEFFIKKENILYLSHLFTVYIPSQLLEKESKILFSLIPEDLKSDLDFIKKLLQRNYAMFSSIKPFFQDDPDLLIFSMKKTDGKVFSYYHEELKSDPFFVYKMNEMFPVIHKELKGKARDLVSRGISIEKFINLIEYQSLMNTLPTNNKSSLKLKV